MNSRIRQWFIYAAGTFLFLASALNFWLAAVSGRALDVSDAYIFLSGRQLFCLVGAIQIALSGFLLLADKRYERRKLGLVAWLATLLLIHRCGLMANAAPDMFGCLGNLTDRLSIPPQTFSPILVVIYSGLFTGASGLLVFDWLARRKVARAQVAGKSEPEFSAASGARANEMQQAGKTAHC